MSGSRVRRGLNRGRRMTERHLSIAVLSGDPPSHFGGLGRTVGILRDGLSSRGHRVDCYYPKARVGELKFSGIALTDFGDYDVVHVHGPTPFLSDAICLNRTVKTLVLTYHSDNEWFSHLASVAYQRVHRLLHARTSWILFESDAYLRRYSSRLVRATVIPPPGPAWAPRSDAGDVKGAEFVVLFVGQLRPYKGIPVLIEAARRLPSVKFLIAGTGRLASDLRDRASDGHNIEFLGALDAKRLEDAYLRAHVICLPSANTSEAFGLTLTEGASLGAVPVASDLPGVAEHTQSLGGVTFRVGDAAGLAAIISGFDRDRAAWLRKSRESAGNARAYCLIHTNDRFVEEHEAVFRSLTSSQLRDAPATG
jgi:glycosyltransferase involved in cell wall biosynthesis